MVGLTLEDKQAHPRSGESRQKLLGMEFLEAIQWESGAFATLLPLSCPSPLRPHPLPNWQECKLYHTE